MTGPIVHDFPTWVKDVNRRVEILERRRNHAGNGTGGGGTGGGGAVGFTATATFVSGAATLPVPTAASGMPIVVGGFAVAVGAGLDARVVGGSVELYASVTNGGYPVNLIFAVAS